MIAKWFLVVIFFAAADGDVATNARVFVGESSEECAEAKAFVQRAAAAREAPIWAECYEVKRAPQPPVKQRATPDDPASEVRS